MEVKLPATWKAKNLPWEFLMYLCELTLPETNRAPKNGWLEYYFPIGDAYFQGIC